MATKKGKSVLDGTNPPILVGGGGSSYLWVNLDQKMVPVNPSLDDAIIGINPGAPTPKDRDKYSASRTGGAPVQLFFFDGDPTKPEQQLHIQDKKKWYIRIA